MATDVTAPDQSSSPGAVHATYDAAIETPAGEPYSRSQVPLLPQREYAMLRGNITACNTYLAERGDNTVAPEGTNLKHKDSAK
jgi:hypothetical protein